MLLAVWQGGLVHFTLTLIIMILALYELNKILSAMEIEGSLLMMVLGVFILAVCAYVGSVELLGFVIPLFIVVYLSTVVFLYPGVKPRNAAGGLLGIFYVVLFLFFFLTRTLENGLIWVVIMLIGTWAGDTAAFVIGKKFGRKKLFPQLSPGKTVEGALGGITGCVLVIVLINHFTAVTSFQISIILGLLLGVTGIIGDLFESSLKRAAGIKDSGGIIPGHGGMLDRFDSLFFIAPVMYYFIYFIAR